MQRQRSCLLLVLASASLSLGCSLHRNAHIAPTADVDIDVKVLAAFQEEVEDYVELHRELLERNPRVGPNATAQEIAAHRDKMIRGIQAKRKGAKRGDIFEAPVEKAIRRVIAAELARPDGAQVVQEILQGNPRAENVPNRSDPTRSHAAAVIVAVNGVYNDDAPLSSMPPSLLLKLPQLPEQVRYQFVGQDLILRDAEANLILDFIKGAVTSPAVPRQP